MSSRFRSRGHRSVNDEILTATIRHLALFEQLKLGKVYEAIATLNVTTFNPALELIEERLSRGIADATVVGMINDLNELLDRGYSSALVDVRDGLGVIAQAEAEWQARLIEKVVPIRVSMELPAPSYLSAIAESEPFEGRLLEDWWGTLRKGTQRRVESTLKESLKEGLPLDDIVTRLRGNPSNRFSDGVLQMSRVQTEAVVRTAIQNVSTAARDATIEENDDLFSGWQFVATLDSRTTVVCMAHDGKVYKIGEGEAHSPPLHFGCRSTKVPVLKSAAALGLKSLPVGKRASMDGEVPETVTYGDWLKTQPAKVQDAILGPGKAAIFRSGNVPLERFVTRRNRPLTLAELRELDEAA